MNRKEWLQAWAEAQATDCSLDLEALEKAMDECYQIGYRHGQQDGFSRAQNAYNRQDMGQ